MRVLFWGTPPFAIPALNRLHEHDDHIVVVVVTQPDKPRGRGRKPLPTVVKKRAERLSLPVLQPTTTRDESFVEEIRALAPDVSVVAAYGKILHPEALEIPRHGSYCLHPSLLPKYRGAAPIQRSLMDGVRETGVTLFRMDEGMDTGPLLLQKPARIEDNETLDSLTERLALESADLLIEGLDLLESGEAELTPQPPGATVAPKITKDEARIDWTGDAEEIERKIRALCSKPGASTLLDGRVLKIYGARVLSAGDDADPGTVVRAETGQLVVAAGRDRLSLTELQLEGKKRMDVESFLRGKKIPVGTRLG